VSLGAVSETPWAPLPDDRLSWFRVDGQLFYLPRPLDYTLEIHALVFGLTYALESIEFPLHALRSRLVNGRVYLAAVPSAVAEADLAQRLKNIHAQSVRFTRNIEGAWERQIQPEVERYNRRFAELGGFTGPAPELAQRLRQLRRERGNQWFAAIRGVIAPTVLLEQNLSEFGVAVVETAKRLGGAALALVAEQGGELITTALTRIGQRLTDAGVIARAEDIFWLEWQEVTGLLLVAADRCALVAERKRHSGLDFNVTMPDSVGPDLPAGAPRMYLLADILRMLDG
jgi:hypothetical protein